MDTFIFTFGISGNSRNRIRHISSTQFITYPIHHCDGLVV